MKGQFGGAEKKSEVVQHQTAAIHFLTLGIHSLGRTGISINDIICWKFLHADLHLSKGYSNYLDHWLNPSTKRRRRICGIENSVGLGASCKNLNFYIAEFRFLDNPSLK